MKDLRNFTPARVGLRRAGGTLAIAEVLDFQLAHARARDAVWCPFDARALCDETGGIIVRTAVSDRAEYLRRPDLGRRLRAESRVTLQAIRGEYDVVFVVADGLSALAVHRNAPALLRAMRARLDPQGWRIAPIVVVEQGRVAIGDEIGELLGAPLAVVLIRERPGLSSCDSLGVYLTWSPRPGRTDAERNCISNIRPDGLRTEAAAELLLLLMSESRSRRLSGVRLKLSQTFIG